MQGLRPPRVGSTVQAPSFRAGDICHFDRLAKAGMLS